MNKTEHYDLNQWELHDRVMMQDFNSDNAKIDAALKTEADARAAADATLTGKVAKCGNCRMEVTTYTGTGTYGIDKPTRISFSARPAVFFILGARGMMTGQGGAAKGNRIVYDTGSRTTGMTDTNFTWSGNTVSFCEGTAAAQLNESGALYCVLALYRMD